MWIGLGCNVILVLFPQQKWAWVWEAFEEYEMNSRSSGQMYCQGQAGSQRSQSQSQSQSSESVTWPHTQSAETGPYTTAWSQNCCKQLLLRSVATKARVFVDRFWMSGPWVLSPAGTVLSLSCTGGALGWYGSGSLCRYGSEFVSAGHWFPAVCSAQPTCHAAPHWPNDAQLHLCSTPVSAPIC